MRKTLWTPNFTLLTVATMIGAAGGIASSFALSFLVFDETGSTLASALLLGVQLIPTFLIPLLVAPLMDRLPRKPFLVAGDAVNGILYALAGLYLMTCEFSYAMYMLFSLLLASLGAFDSLAYHSLYPQVIPEGFEQKGYTVSGMVYPTMKVIMTPIAALLFQTVGVAVILLIQGALSVIASLVESRVQVKETDRSGGEPFSFRLWKNDLLDAVHYLRREKGIQSIYAYMAATNGVGEGYAPLMIAFFRTAPGFTVAMYSAFAVVEFAGRMLGGLFQYLVKIPRKKQFSFAFMVYQVYEIMDMLLLWLPYPLMLVSRAICGFLGINSATMRHAAVQRYIPDELRAKLNAFESILISGVSCVLTLLLGALGEILDYRLCITLAAAFACLCCWATIWRKRKAVRVIYEYNQTNDEA